MLITATWFRIATLPSGRMKQLQTYKHDAVFSAYILLLPPSLMPRSIPFSLSYHKDAVIVVTGERCQNSVWRLRDAQVRE